jgi:hypothetical protein
MNNNIKTWFIKQANIAGNRQIKFDFKDPNTP